MKTRNFCFAALMFLGFLRTYAQEIQEFKDPRDGIIYKVIKYSWVEFHGKDELLFEFLIFGENLKYKLPGSLVYRNMAPYETKYGRLYSFNEALKACPPGWRLPTKEEWLVLRDALTEMYPDNRECVNCPIMEGGNSKLGLLLAGNWENETDWFSDLGEYGTYWSSDGGDKVPPGKAIVLHIVSPESKKLSRGTAWIAVREKVNRYSCRCVKN